MANRERTLAPAELASARAALAAARGRKRLDVILDARDPEALVRALPADELYFTIREIGLGDAAVLAQLASPEQFRTFLDLDSWSGDRFAPRKALPWLRAARAGAHRDPRSATRWERKLAGLDREVIDLVLRDTLRIHDLELDPDPEIQGEYFMRTPENRYVVEFAAEGTEYAAVRGLIDDLYAQDPFQATRLLSAIRWEFPSELEESALRWRTGRLADLGYPSLEEALSWFARPPKGPSAHPAGAPSRPPGFFLATLARGSLLDRAAAPLAGDERDAVEQEIVAAANAVIVADAVDPADADAVRAAFEAARALLELGLEQLAPDDAGAAEVLRTTPVKRIFQEGFGRVLALRWRAERLLAAGGAGTRDAPLLDAPIGEAVSALASRRRPLYFPGLEAPREDWGAPAASAFEPRRFLTAADLSRTAAALDLAEGLAGLARAHGLAVRAEGPLAPRLSALYLTALANERLGRAFVPSPLAPEELPRAARALAAIEDARLAGPAGELLLALARQRAEELALAREGGDLDPSRVTALLVRDA